MDAAKIIIATNKEYRLPEDSIYLPVQVGAALTDKKIQRYTPDSTGDNISGKNASYCELTGLYWAWKNLDAGVTGLVHYRRYFGMPDTPLSLATGDKAYDYILTGEELTRLMEKHDIILPRKRKYFIETLKSHYAHTHYMEQITQSREIIGDKYPEYLPAFDRVMNRTSGHMFNMMIMKREYLEQYAGWLFDVLSELEFINKDNEMSPYQGRYIGRIGELVLNVWLDYQIELGNIARDRICELPVIQLGKVKWGQKISAFLMAKFFHRRYEHSF